MNHYKQLEAEGIEIIREAVAGSRKPVMMYSIGKDSSVMLHLARKAFYPAPPPFPLLHIDTTWKFQEMYAHRKKMAEESGMELIVHTNPEGKKAGINPFTHGSSYYTDVMKTQGLRQALDHHGFDVVFGGARRDEEKSRAKERIFSFRSAGHRWDPKLQRPELWNLYNTRMRPGETIRVFPLSNWTELDIWQYLHVEKIPIVPLYFAKERIFSFRSAGHRWDPKLQRPELWNPYNTRMRPGETIRVFPLSNWTELDIWQYLHVEKIPIVPLYFAKQRPVVIRNGQLIMVDDNRIPIEPGEKPQMRMIRFRTLGCYPLTAAIDSPATTMEEIIAETFNTVSSEREGRLIDSDQPGSMEKKKQEGYF